MVVLAHHIYTNFRFSVLSCVSCLRMPKRKASGNKSSGKKAAKTRKSDHSEASGPVNNQSELGDSVDAKISAKSNVKDNFAEESSLKVKLNTKDGRLNNFKIASFNVAGVRAWAKKDGHKWLLEEKPDVICLQETKCPEKEIPQALKDMKEYNIFWNVAKSTKGFSGVALMSKVEPMKVDFGIGVEEHDQEGRTITAEYEQFFCVTTYVPNSQRGLKRLEYRMRWNNDFKAYLQTLDAKKPVVLCGDMNVSHLEIDLANPKSNKRSAGFTQEERDGMSALLDCGFVDTFRHFYPDDTQKYTFWTYMGNARAKNVGWRLDYFIVSERWMNNVCDSIIASSAMGSDHCPIVLLLALP